MSIDLLIRYKISADAMRSEKQAARNKSIL